MPKTRSIHLHRVEAGKYPLEGRVPQTPPDDDGHADCDGEERATASKPPQESGVGFTWRCVH